MSRARMTLTDYRASVVAVPPIALSEDLEVAQETNLKLIRRIESGGVRSLLFGGNANLYNFDLGRYAGALAMMDAAAAPGTHVIASIRPDFGKLSDQALVVKRSAIPPMISSVPAAALEKVKEVMNRPKEADRSAGEAALAGSE